MPPARTKPGRSGGAASSKTDETGSHREQRHTQKARKLRNNSSSTILAQHTSKHDTLTTACFSAQCMCVAAAESGAFADRDPTTVFRFLVGSTTPRR